MEGHQLEGGVGGEANGLLLPGEGVLRTAVPAGRTDTRGRRSIHVCIIHPLGSAV